MIYLAVLLIVLLAGLHYLFNNGKARNSNKTLASPLTFTKEPIAAKPLVTDQKSRDLVLKQKFKPERVPENLDAVIVGSGIGGLSVAALLAKAGWKVLVLEQHDTAGGCCHTFIEKGFEFDIGIHYIGECLGNTDFRLFMDQITDGQLQWASLGDCYDTVLLGEAGKHETIPMPTGPQRFQEVMAKRFPGEEKNIRAILQSMREVQKQMERAFMLKAIPMWISKFVIASGLIHWFTSFFKLAEQSAADFLQKMTPNKKLQTVFTYISGDYGAAPEDASWAMLASVWAHFWYGAAYPVGGASEIPFSIIPVIERAGGKVLVKARVKRITVDEGGRANGVIVVKGNNEFPVQAPIVVSDAGVINTFSKLLPEEIASTSRYVKYIQSIGSGKAAMQLFVGLRGDSADLDMTSGNFWVFADSYVDDSLRRLLDTPVEDMTDWPLLFVSCPSAKDPSWHQRYPGKSVCTVVTFGDAKWFKKWEHLKVKKRGDEYERLKQELSTLIWTQTVKYFPQLEGQVEYMELGSPLSNQHYLNSPNGEVYGLDHSLARMTPTATMDLRPETDIPGLYLTGQDILSCGFAGAAYGGLLTSSVLLNRNLFDELKAMRKLKGKVGV